MKASPRQARLARALPTPTVVATRYLRTWNAMTLFTRRQRPRAAHVVAPSKYWAKTSPNNSNWSLHGYVSSDIGA